MRARDLDPTGEHHGGTPTYPWRMAPADEGLATRRQLRALGLRIGGQPVAAQILCRRGTRYAVRVPLPHRPGQAGQADDARQETGPGPSYGREIDLPGV